LSVSLTGLTSALPAFPTRRSSDLPYGSGHMMVAPKRHVAGYLDLTDDENVALARVQTRALQAIQDAYGPDGANVGANLGRAAGADRKSTRLNSSHQIISYAVFCLK